MATSPQEVRMKEQQESTATLDASQFRDLTYPRLRINDFTLDENLPTPLDCSVYTSPEVGLGSLDIFPLELLQRILSQLDMRTLTDFRRVNHLALQLVASIPHYKAINTHAPHVLRGILGIETGRWITCETSTPCSARVNASTAAILVATSISLLANVSTSSVLPKNKHISRYDIPMRSRNSDPPVRSSTPCRK